MGTILFIATQENIKLPRFVAIRLIKNLSTDNLLNNELLIIAMYTFRWLDEYAAKSSELSTRFGISGIY